jgi:hypothetical protein
MATMIKIRKSQKTLAAQVGGQIVRFEKAKDGWTISVMFKPAPRRCSPTLAELCRGIEYWSAKLDDETARQLQIAFEEGNHISFDTDLLKRISFRAVPWQRFLVAAS